MLFQDPTGTLKELVECGNVKIGWKVATKELLRDFPFEKPGAKDSHEKECLTSLTTHSLLLDAFSYHLFVILISMTTTPCSIDTEQQHCSGST